MDRIKIFISAYACEPGLGSEIGVGWHWVLEMSKYFELWVLTRKSNQENIENWFEKNSIENKPHFLYYDLPKKYRFWKRGLRGVRTYYVLWQKLTNKIVRKTMEVNNIEVYHLLTYGNGLWPASCYGIQKTFIWGPMGVGSYVAPEYTKYYGLRNRIKERLQRFMVKTLPYNRGFKNRCKKASLVLCKTDIGQSCIPEQDRNKAIVFTDVAVELFDTSKYQYHESDVIEYLAVGRLEAWRGFDLLIEAFAKATEQNKKLHLNILGRGDDRDRLLALITKLGVKEYITLVGQVSMEQYYQYMADCDVIVNPTLKEGAVTVAFDSLSFLKPLICVNTGGYTHYFTNEYAVVLDLVGREELISELSIAIMQLTDKNTREQMSEYIKKIRNQFTWEEKGKQIRDIILKTLKEKVNG